MPGPEDLKITVSVLKGISLYGAVYTMVCISNASSKMIEEHEEAADLVCC